MLYKLFLITMLFTHNAYGGDFLKNSMATSASGMKSQQQRIRIIAQNMANKDSVALLPGGAPYRRQIIYMKAKKIKNDPTNIVLATKYGTDKSSFKKTYDPSHPAADGEGYVLYPNVDIVIENVDSKDAATTYEANLNMLDLSKNMYLKTIEILK